MKRDGLSASFAYQYREVDSPVHRMGAGWKLALTCALGAAAAAGRTPWALGVLAVLNFAYYLAAGLKWKDLWSDVRLFLLQTVVVAGLYLLKYGPGEGLEPGLLTGAQILLFFMPSVVLLRSTKSSQMMGSLKRFLPAYLSFLVFTSLRFVPFFVREVREIVMVQRLRGARVAPRCLLNPLNWREVVHCVAIPLIVRSLKIAGETALSAEARGFGRNRKGGQKVGSFGKERLRTTPIEVEPKKTFCNNEECKP